MTATKPKPGDIRHFNFQSDIYELPYELVELIDPKRNLWRCRYAEPSLDKIEEILNDPNPYCGGEAEALQVIDRIGKEFEVRLVSHEEWSRAF